MANPSDTISLLVGANLVFTPLISCAVYPIICDYAGSRTYIEVVMSTLLGMSITNFLVGYITCP